MQRAVWPWAAHIGKWGGSSWASETTCISNKMPNMDVLVYTLQGPSFFWRSFSVSTTLKHTLISVPWHCWGSKLLTQVVSAILGIHVIWPHPPINKLAIKSPEKWQPAVAEKRATNAENGGPTRQDSYFLSPFMLKTTEMALPVPTKTFQSQSPDAHMLFAPSGCTHPPPPVPPFLLSQNLSPKDIAGCDIMKLKVSRCRYATLGLKGIYISNKIAKHGCNLWLEYKSS